MTYISRPRFPTILFIAAGAFLNLLIGALSASYLTRLSTEIPQHRRGLVFGIAYAFGSVGTWLLSFPMNGKFLWNRESFLPSSYSPPFHCY